MRNHNIQTMASTSGFTLIEAIVAVAIVGIIGAVAWPAYQAQSMKNRRAEAVSDLTRIKIFMSRCYADRGGYECCDDAALTAYQAANPPPLPPARQYTLTFTPTNVNGGAFACKQAQGYTVTATPTAGGAQVNDSCTSFTIDHLGARTAAGAANLACWAD